MMTIEGDDGSPRPKKSGISTYGYRNPSTIPVGMADKVLELLTMLANEDPERRERWEAYRAERDAIIVERKKTGELYSSAVNLPKDEMRALMRKHGLVKDGDTTSEADE